MVKHWTTSVGDDGPPSYEATDGRVFDYFLPKLHPIDDRQLYAVIKNSTWEEWAAKRDFLAEVRKSYPDAELSTCRVTIDGTESTYDAILLGGASARRFEQAFNAKQGPGRSLP